MYPIVRMRRLRQSENIRALNSAVVLNIKDFVYPIFVSDGANIEDEVESMPGVYRYSIDRLEKIVDEVVLSGIKAVILFGVPAKKDNIASEAYNENGVVQNAIRKIKEIYPKLIVITDVCLCEYTIHGHCGILYNGEILNDSTLEILTRIAVSHGKAGADIVAPSDMMDGRVHAIRTGLDENGLQNVAIMSYSAKYASEFYGPFRDAAFSAAKYGDRKSYQMDPACSTRQAIEETALDIEEGADYIMVKPAMAYMDIIREIRSTFNSPLVTYSVSGEYAMFKAAARNGWINEKEAVLEYMVGLKKGWK